MKAYTTVWRWQRNSALLAIPLLGFHVIYQYFVIGIDGINFETVTSNVSVAGLLLIDLLLLITVTFHAFAGIYNISRDYTSSSRTASRIAFLLGAAFVITVAYAIAALIAFL